MYVFLGNPLRTKPNLRLDSLPTNKEVLKLYFWYQDQLGGDEAHAQLVTDLIGVCYQLELEPALRQNLDKKLKSLIKRCRNVCKSRNKANFLKQANTVYLLRELDLTFDISSQADPVSRRRKVRNEQFERRLAKEEERRTESNAGYSGSESRRLDL